MKDKRITNHLLKRKAGGSKAKWTKKEVIKDALKYNSRKMWRQNSSGAISSAYRNGWYKEAVKHMYILPKPGKPRKWTKELVLKDALLY